MGRLRSGSTSKGLRCCKELFLWAWQAFPFPISGELYKVSYQKLLAKTLDTTNTQDMTAVVDTETYYQSLTQDGTTLGDS